MSGCNLETVTWNFHVLWQCLPLAAFSWAICSFFGGHFYPHFVMIAPNCSFMFTLWLLHATSPFKQFLSHSIAIFSSFCLLTWREPSTNYHPQLNTIYQQICISLSIIFRCARRAIIQMQYDSTFATLYLHASFGSCHKLWYSLVEKYTKCIATTVRRL